MLKETNPLTDMYSAPTTFRELLDTVAEYFHDNVWGNTNQFIYFGLRLQYSETVSLSHNAPFGKSTNWGGRNPDLPRNAPGWWGRIWVGLANAFDHDRFFNLRETISSVGIHPGTGGGGEYSLPKYVKEKLPHYGWSSWESWGWDVSVFEEDWPAFRMAHLIDPQDHLYSGPMFTIFRLAKNPAFCATDSEFTLFLSNYRNYNVLQYT